MRLLETLGEATMRISKETKQIHSHIPWRSVTDMRNRLIHGYDDIDYPILWRSLNTDIEPLLSKLRQLKLTLEKDNPGMI